MHVCCRASPYCFISKFYLWWNDNHVNAIGRSYSYLCKGFALPYKFRILQQDTVLMAHHLPYLMTSQSTGGNIIHEKLVCVLFISSHSLQPFLLLSRMNDECAPYDAENAFLPIKDDQREWKRNPVIDALSPLNKIDCVEHPKDEEVKDCIRLLIGWRCSFFIIHPSSLVMK